MGKTDNSTLIPSVSAFKQKIAEIYFPNMDWKGYFNFLKRGGRKLEEKFLEKIKWFDDLSLDLEAVVLEIFKKILARELEEIQIDVEYDSLRAVNKEVADKQIVEQLMRKIRRKGEVLRSIIRGAVEEVFDDLETYRSKKIWDINIAEEIEDGLYSFLEGMNDDEFEEIFFFIEEEEDNEIFDRMKKIAEMCSPEEKPFLSVWKKEERAEIFDRMKKVLWKSYYKREFEKEFDTLYDNTDFRDLADVLNRVYKIEPPSEEVLELEGEEREYYFDSTLYGEHLLIVPRPQYGQGDFIELPISWTDDWRRWVGKSFSSLIEDAIEEGIRDRDDFVWYVMKRWAEDMKGEIEDQSGLTLLERERKEDVKEDIAQEEGVDKGVPENSEEPTNKKHRGKKPRQK